MSKFGGEILRDSGSRALGKLIVEEKNLYAGISSLFDKYVTYNLMRSLSVSDWATLSSLFKECSGIETFDKCCLIMPSVRLMAHQTLIFLRLIGSLDCDREVLEGLPAVYLFRVVHSTTKGKNVIEMFMDLMVDILRESGMGLSEIQAAYVLNYCLAVFEEIIDTFPPDFGLCAEGRMEDKLAPEDIEFINEIIEYMEK